MFKIGDKVKILGGYVSGRYDWFREGTEGVIREIQLHPTMGVVYMVPQSAYMYPEDRLELVSQLHRVYIVITPETRSYTATSVPIAGSMVLSFEQWRHIDWKTWRHLLSTTFAPAKVNEQALLKTN